MNPNRTLITGKICGIRVEEIEDPLMRDIRYLDKLVDELAKGKSIIKASNQATTPLLGHRCRSSQEITGSPTPFSTSNHYLWICASASFSLSNPNIAA